MNNIFFRSVFPLFVILSAALILAPRASLARPEYAARMGLIHCNGCHVNPGGGGPRTVNGKLYASHRNEVGATAMTDSFSGDFRFLALFPEKMVTASSSGLTVMTAIVGANVPITELSDGRETRAVAAYQLGLQGSTPLRDAYVIHQLKPAGDNGLVKNILFGRFNVPFGIATDEHRTYTRLQNKSTIYDFEMGVMVSGDLFPIVHHDFAFTSGFQNGGTFASNDIPYSLLGNVRVKLPRLPLYVGWSGSVHRSFKLAYNPYSTALFFGLSLDQLTRGRIGGSIVGEVQIAKGWNSTNPPIANPQLGKFADDAYFTFVRDSQTIGAYLLATWEMTRHWAPFYKLDRLAFDQRYPADAFTRHSLGAKYFFNGHLSLSGRYEISNVGLPALQDSGLANSRNAWLLLLHAGI